MTGDSKFGLETLGALYDRGRLVPFIGSGMSMPNCASWKSLVLGLEKEAGITGSPEDEKFPLRASKALRNLRQQGADVGSMVSKAIYPPEQRPPPPQTEILASFFWPLICTTNYDDLYFQAKFQYLEKRQALRSVPKILGRSELHCREILEHLSFPATEVVWALQGFLPRADSAYLDAAGPNFPRARFERELVVGHEEYRREAHRAPHFRRTFAELFRARSLLFLGSGLGEPYFLSLFDEIIELTGPPAQPHFAIVEQGKVDTEFLQKEYHILCNTYPAGKHGHVVEALKDLRDYTMKPRVRPGQWGYRLNAPAVIERDEVSGQFTVVRGAFPDRMRGAEDEVFAISCGRDPAPVEAADDENRGVPGPSMAGVEMLGLEQFVYQWESDWTVKWVGAERAYGIVARDKFDGKTSADQRSAKSIQSSFEDFLVRMRNQDVRRVHVQLLGAGKGRVFQPWVSLSQMARAYGEVFRFPGLHRRSPPRVNVYVVDRGVIALLQGGYLDLVPQLQGAPLRITVEVIDAFGRVERHHEVVSADCEVGAIVGRVGKNRPVISARPAPRRLHAPQPLDVVSELSARNFGIVSGSTLTVDYSKNGYASC